MIEPKEYKLNNHVNSYKLINVGFSQKGDTYKFVKTLYRYDNNGKLPYVILKLYYADNELYETVCCDDGSMYVPFYNLDLRHDNRVYDAVVNNYNQVMDYLVKQRILKYARKHDDQRKNPKIK